MINAKPGISVVMSTYNRAAYLSNSLSGYWRCTIGVPVQLIIIDDGSTDDTDQVVRAWQAKLDIVYIRLTKPEGLWRDCAATLNMAIRAASYSLVIPTHPEVIPGVNSLQDLWDRQEDRAYLCCKTYYLTPDNQARLVPKHWMPSNLGVRTLPGFYNGESPEVRQHDDYSHESTDRLTSWGSWVFGGMQKETWRWFGGFAESNAWGSVDVDFLTRRGLLGIKHYTATDPETIVIHQNHDLPMAGDRHFVAVPRNMDLAMSSVRTYQTPEEARLGLI